MLYAVDAQCTVRESLLSVHQESVINDTLVNMAFHVDRGLRLLVGVDQISDHIERSRIVIPVFRQSGGGSAL